MRACGSGGPLLVADKTSISATSFTTASVDRMARMRNRIHAVLGSQKCRCFGIDCDQDTTESRVKWFFFFSICVCACFSRAEAFPSEEQLKSKLRVELT